jgi:hypothetical protein
LVYLLHFSEKLHHAGHYVGYTEKETITGRLDRHKCGHGSKLMAAVVGAGIGVTVARVWEDGDRGFERQLKRQKNSRRFCPICKELKKGECLKNGRLDYQGP